MKTGRLALILAAAVCLAAATDVDRARTLAGQGRTDDAIELLRRVSSGSTDASAHNMLGALLNRDGQYAEALVHARRAAELQPDNPRYRYNRGIVLAEHGRFEEARKDFDFAITRTPAEAPMYLERGAALLSLGQDGDARADWATARRIDPKLVWIDWYEGLHDLIDGRRASASTKLEAVAAEEPAFATAQGWLALIHRLEGNEFRGQRTGDPWINSILEFHAGHRSFAELMKAAKSDRKSGDERRIGEAWLHHAATLQSAGRADDAASAYRKAIATSAPRHAWKLLAERELERLSRDG